MRITLGQCYRAQGALQELGTILTGKSGYRLGRITEAITKELERAEKTRTEIIQAYNCKNPDEKIGGYMVPPDKLEEFQKQWADLLTVEVEFWGRAFTWEELGKQGEAIPGSVFSAALWLFEVEEEKATEKAEGAAG